MTWGAKFICHEYGGDLQLEFANFPDGAEQLDSKQFGLLRIHSFMATEGDKQYRVALKDPRLFLYVRPLLDLWKETGKATVYWRDAYIKDSPYAHGKPLDTTMVDVGWDWTKEVQKTINSNVGSLKNFAKPVLWNTEFSQVVGPPMRPTVSKKVLTGPCYYCRRPDSPRATPNDAPACSDCRRRYSKEKTT